MRILLLPLWAWSIIHATEPLPESVPLGFQKYIDRTVVQKPHGTPRRFQDCAYENEDIFHALKAQGSVLYDAEEKNIFLQQNKVEIYNYKSIGGRARAIFFSL